MTHTDEKPIAICLLIRSVTSVMDSGVRALSGVDAVGEVRGGSGGAGACDSKSVD